MRITVGPITFHETHFAVMKKDDAVRAIIKEAEGAGVNIGETEKDKKAWAEKVYSLMVKKEGPE